MLSREDILKELKKNPDWQPTETATDEEWMLYEDIKEELEMKEDPDDDLEFDDLDDSDIDDEELFDEDELEDEELEDEEFVG